MNLDVIIRRDRALAWALAHEACPEALTWLSYQPERFPLRRIPATWLAWATAQADWPSDRIVRLLQALVEHDYRVVRALENAGWGAARGGLEGLAHCDRSAAGTMARLARCDGGLRSLR